MTTRRTRPRPRRRTLELANRDRLVQHGLPRLLRAARQEIAVREADGDLPPGQVDAQEVVDQALVEMLPHLSALGSMERALVAVQHRIPRLLDALVARVQRERDELDELEGDRLHDVPLGSISEVVEHDVDGGLAGEDLARDDALSLGHALPDGGDPEDEAADGDLRRRLLRALFLLPPERRRLFEAVVVDGWRSDHVAATFGLTEDAVDGEIRVALTALAERLSVQDEADVRRWYEALGERLRDEHASSYFSPGHAM